MLDPVVRAKVQFTKSTEVRLHESFCRAIYSVALLTTVVPLTRTFALISHLLISQVRLEGTTHGNGSILP